MSLFVHFEFALSTFSVRTSQAAAIRVLELCTQFQARRDASRNSGPEFEALSAQIEATFAPCGQSRKGMIALIWRACALSKSSFALQFFCEQENGQADNVAHGALSVLSVISREAKLARGTPFKLAYFSQSKQHPLADIK